MKIAYGLKKPGSGGVELDSISDTKEKAWEYFLGRWERSMPVSREERIKQAESDGYSVVAIELVER